MSHFEEKNASWGHLIRRRFRCRPVVELLENRQLLSCGSQTVPWCLDDGFTTSSFPEGHVFIDDFQGKAHSVAIQYDGNGDVLGIILAGYEQIGSGSQFSVMRLEPDGDLDTTFSNNSAPNGYTSVEFFDDASLEQAFVVAIQPSSHSNYCDGEGSGTSPKIVVGGQAFPIGNNPTPISVIGVMRFCATGSNAGELDTSFGHQPIEWDTTLTDPYGMVSIAPANPDPGDPSTCPGIMREGAATGIDFDDDGDILVGGWAKMSSGSDGDEFAIARLDADTGTRDSTFGDTPISATCNTLTHYFAGSTEFPIASNARSYDIDVDEADDSIVMAGYTIRDSNPANFAVAKLIYDGANDGDLDTTFDSSGDDDGIVIINFGGDDTANALTPQLISSTKYVVVAGTISPTSGDDDFALARILLSNGDLDSNFDGDGKLIVDYDDGTTDEEDDTGTGVDLQSNNEIVVGGYTDPSGATPAFFSGLRVGVNGTGTPEPIRSDFVTSGTDGADQAFDLVAQNDDKIVVAGFHTHISESVSRGFAAIRLCPEPDDTNPDCEGSRENPGTAQTPKISLVLATDASNKAATELLETPQFLPGVLAVVPETHSKDADDFESKPMDYQSPGPAPESFPDMVDIGKNLELEWGGIV